MAQSDIQLTDLKCPNCGSPINLPDGADVIHCNACGSNIHVTRRNVMNQGVSADGTTPVVDKYTHQTIAHVKVCDGWRLLPGQLSYENPSYTYPMKVHVTLMGPNGALLMYAPGESFSQVGSFFQDKLPNDPFVTYRDFVAPAAYLDQFANAMFSSRANSIKLVGVAEMPVRGGVDRQVFTQRLQTQLQQECARNSAHGVIAMADGVFFDAPCRVYEIAMKDGSLQRFAIATHIEGRKSHVSAPGMMTSPLGLLGGLLGSAFGGGGFGGMGGNDTPDRSGTGFGQLASTGVLDWGSRHLFMLQAPADSFDEAWANGYVDLCSSFYLDQSIVQQITDYQQQIIRAKQQETDQAINAMNQQFQAMQAANAARQAAFDRQLDSWWANSNADHAQVMSSGSGSGYSAADKWSEAIRGVNTYMRPDGSEVELSVGSDRGWISQGGTVIGTSGSFEPGADWTELDRKR